MKKLSNIILYSNNPKHQEKFYTDILGMQSFGNYTVGYGGLDATITFRPTQHPYQPSTNDLYWKISLALPNIELAFQQLRKIGINVNPPAQFRDIGYLAHLNDPEGFKIELINHTFESDSSPSMRVDKTKFGGGAHFNLLSLRTATIKNAHDSCRKLGMKLLSIQPVKEHGFTLYFYAFTDELPPINSLFAIENRTWLYERHYTVLELQHVHNADSIRIRHPLGACK